MGLTSFDELEISFKRIDDNINNLKSKHKAEINKPFPLNKLVNLSYSCINESRERLLRKLKNYQIGSLEAAEILYNTDFSLTTKSIFSTKCFPVIFREGDLRLNNVLFEMVAYTNEFDLYKKIKFSHLWQNNVELILLDDKYQNRGDWHVIPFTKEKLIIHSKITNSIKLFIRKSGNFSCLIRELNFESKYFVTTFVNNSSQVIIGLSTGREFVLNIYDECLDLIRSSQTNLQYSTGFRIVCINDKEIICWSFSKQYFILDYHFNEKADTSINYNKVSGPLIHISNDRVFFMSENNELEILDRSGEYLNSIKIKTYSLCCIKVDQDSRIFIKTKKDLLSQKLFCYDKNGHFLIENDLDRRLEPYDCFTILNNYSIGFIDFSQNNYVLF